MKIQNIAHLSYYNHPYSVKNNSKNNQQNYSLNVPFTGFFSNFQKPTVPRIDAVNAMSDITMNPNNEYQVDEDTIFSLGGVELALNDKDFGNLLNTMKPNCPMIIGREALMRYKFTRYTSGKHLSISKTKDGKFYARDLNSLNGSLILANTKPLGALKADDKLNSRFKYEVEPNSKFGLGPEVVFEMGEYSKIKNMKDGDKIIVGRDASSDIKLENPYISKKHLKISKNNGRYFVRDLNSTNGTKFAGVKQDNFVDRTKIDDVVSLKPNTPTIIPNDCQLLLGYDLAIDMRNKNITSLLDKKDKITIGRNEECDVVVKGFFNQVSSKHLELSKVNGRFVARDLNSTNGTEIIPNNRINPFYKGVENLEFEQENVGDCYLLTAIYALSKHPKGASLIEKMVKIDKDGNYIVEFPNGYPISIRPDELDGQQLNGDTKNSVTGELGIKAIERAYGRYIKIGSENATMFAQIDDGGFVDNAIEKLTDKYANRVYLDSILSIDDLFSDLERKGFDNFVFACSTKHSDDYYIDPKKKYVSSHAYAIKNINTKKRTVEIINPHHTKTSQKVDFDEFQKYFRRLYYADMR